MTVVLLDTFSDGRPQNLIMQTSFRDYNCYNRKHVDELKFILQHDLCEMRSPNCITISDLLLFLGR